MEHQETPWFIAGTIDTQKRHSFERVLWRACRRTAFVRTAEIESEFEDPDTVNKTKNFLKIIGLILLGEIGAKISVHNFLQWKQIARHNQSSL